MIRGQSCSALGRGCGAYDMCSPGCSERTVGLGGACADEGCEETQDQVVWEICPGRHHKDTVCLFLLSAAWKIHILQLGYCSKLDKMDKMMCYFLCYFNCDWVGRLAFILKSMIVNNVIVVCLRKTRERTDKYAYYCISTDLWTNVMWWISIWHWFERVVFWDNFSPLGEKVSELYPVIFHQFKSSAVPNASECIHPQPILFLIFFHFKATCLITQNLLQKCSASWQFWWWVTLPHFPHK